MILLSNFSNEIDFLKTLDNYLYVGIDKDITCKANIDFLISKGKKVLVFTVNDYGLAKKLKNCGVTSIFSDYPKEIFEKNKM